MFGTIITATSGFTFLIGDAFSIIGVLLGLSFLTGVFVVPFVWWSVRQRRDLLLATTSCEVDDDGISMTSSASTTRMSWSVFRRARETNRVFVLDTGAGAAIILLKRAMGPEVTDAVRGVLTRHGLLSDSTGLARRLRPLLWYAVGLGVAAVFVGGLIFASQTEATVAMEAVPTVTGRTVTVDGTTDLPNGTLLDVQVFQFDAWNRARAEGGGAEEDFALIDVQRAVVWDGRFSAEVDMTGWPAGRGMSAVYFWIDSSQPPEVIQRFGRDGSDLKGPHVRQEDTGPTLRIDKGFEIP